MCLNCLCLSWCRENVSLLLIHYNTGNNTVFVSVLYYSPLQASNTCTLHVLGMSLQNLEGGLIANFSPRTQCLSAALHSWFSIHPLCKGVT
ncbi:hypothetical protein AMECASPLE_025697 [Ameca splendens]|uniref:Secreted protein n=1 Tax=Ameca splendens TaxID=208324 RepID=A0ABV0XHQ4_9TELE